MTQDSDYEASYQNEVHQLQTSASSHARNVPKTLPYLPPARMTKQMTKLLNHQKNQTKLTSWLDKIQVNRDVIDEMKKALNPLLR